MYNVPSSYYICSGEQCRTMDERTINEFGIDGFTLMEVAGTKAADFITSKTTPTNTGLFFLGKGNNAGDALVIARILSEKGYSITLCFVDGSSNLSPDATRNFELIKKLQADISIIDWTSKLSPSSYDFIVDGMLGTGLKSNVRAPYSDIIHWINHSGLATFSLDLPSGLNPDTGEIMGSSVSAQFTLTFGALKTGFYLNDGPDYVGDIVLCELPFPNHYKKSSAYLIDDDWVEESIPTTKKRIHKYADGVLYIIAGSEGLTGAATLTAQSAWATGIGAVVLITPKGLLDVYEKNLIQIIKKPVGKAEDTFFKPAHLTQVLKILSDKPGKLLIGPGLSRNELTIEFTQKLLTQFHGDVVIDADALFALSLVEDWEKPNESNWILTPHPGEFKKLFGTTTSSGYERLLQSKASSLKKGITILAKGLPSIIGTSAGDLYLTGYDTRIFSRTGFGDVLAGKVGAYYLEYNDPALACFLALLDGKNKALAFNSETNNNSNLEPINLL